MVIIILSASAYVDTSRVQHYNRQTQQKLMGFIIT